MTGPRPNAQKTHCPHGHALTDDNVIKLRYFRRDGSESFKRQCRACKKQSHKAKDHSKPKRKAPTKNPLAGGMASGSV